jgi:hypothetical protein
LVVRWRGCAHGGHSLVDQTVLLAMNFSISL